VLTLTEGLEQDEFLRSRLTRLETQRQLKTMCETIAALPARTKALLAEVDWSGWSTVARQLDATDDEARDTLWFAVRSLAPATLMWLRVYRKNQPELFEYKPAPVADGASP
jgi:uncharacterized protein with HEPN domain